MVGLTDADAQQSESSARWVPSACLDAWIEPEFADVLSADAFWNRSYLAAIDALEVGDLREASDQFCAALLAARSFEARDWRFAETLDELGLVAFLDADYPRAEAMQGAAVAEMLLAVGPESLERSSAHDRRSGRLSSVPIYASRLKHLYGLLGRESERSSLEAGAHHIFSLEYVPLDRSLAERLDWLVSQYLLAEDFQTAASLSEFQALILSSR